MRVIAGRYKGRRLVGPTGEGTRPTSDRLRETLFNILAGRIEGARVLEGFAGTGALGLEALSRGADHVVFVEQSSRALAVLRRNVAACGAGSLCTIVKADFLSLPRRLRGPAAFDLVLLDPPYDFDAAGDVLDAARARLAPGGLIVFEHSRRRDPPASRHDLTRRRTVTAGDSALAFYEVTTTAPTDADAETHV